MPSKTWGTAQAIQESIVVDGNKEIPLGHKAYVFNKTTSTIGELIVKEDWEAFLRGDLYAIKEALEAQIPGTKVIWIKISWDKAEYKGAGAPGLYFYAVWGFYVEAIVENSEGAGLTGLEIVYIILAIAFLAVVIAAIALGAWIVWEIMTSVPDVVKPFVGVGLLILILLFLLVLFGGQIGVSKKKVTVKGR